MLQTWRLRTTHTHTKREFKRKNSYYFHNKDFGGEHGGPPELNLERTERVGARDCVEIFILIREQGQERVFRCMLCKIPIGIKVRSTWTFTDLLTREAEK